MLEQDEMMFQKGFNRMSVAHNTLRDTHYTVTILYFMYHALYINFSFEVL